MTFRNAQPSDADAVLLLYRSVIGHPYCTWNEYYPGPGEIAEDLRAGDLFVLEAGDQLVGVVSVVPENELDEQPVWTVREGAAEIARVVIQPSYQGQGISRVLVQNVLDVLKKRGYKAVHLSVAEINIPARKTYKSLGFTAVGRVFLYGNYYFLCEKSLL